MGTPLSSAVDLHGDQLRTSFPFVHGSPCCLALLEESVDPFHRIAMPHQFLKIQLFQARKVMLEGAHDGSTRRTSRASQGDRGARQELGFEPFIEFGFQTCSSVPKPS